MRGVVLVYEQTTLLAVGVICIDALMQGLNWCVLAFFFARSQEHLYHVAGGSRGKASKNSRYEGEIGSLSYVLLCQ